MTMTNERPAPVSPIRASKLGEELPIFCEQCGYNLNGLPHIRCEHCDILQFHCPECGHHQPINTLRPAAQRIIGRLRAVWLCAVVLFKLNFFGWMLTAWVGMGGSWSYSARYTTSTASNGQPGMTTVTFQPYPVDFGEIMAFTLLALLFGMVGRMLLLRWRRAERIGVILALLATVAIMVGAEIAYRDYLDSPYRGGGRGGAQIVPPWTTQFIALIAWTAGIIVIAATLVWPIWVMFVRTFLPKHTASILLEWQRSQSDRSQPIDRPLSTLGRQ